MEIAAQVPSPVTQDNGFQNVAPTVSAVDVAGKQRTSFQIAELEEAISKYFDGIPDNEGGQVLVNDDQLPSPDGGAE